jgi:hypothetical protein
VSGFRHPSQVNEAAFETAVAEIAEATQRLLNSLVTKAPPRDRELEAVKAKARVVKRYER